MTRDFFRLVLLSSGASTEVGDVGDSITATSGGIACGVGGHESSSPSTGDSGTFSYSGTGGGGSVGDCDGTEEIVDKRGVPA